MEQLCQPELNRTRVSTECYHTITLDNRLLVLEEEAQYLADVPCATCRLNRQQVNPFDSDARDAYALTRMHSFRLARR